MIPVPVYDPGNYPPPGKQFVQFGDDVLANTLQEAHDKIAAKRTRMMPFHQERLQKHGLNPMRDAAVQAVAHTSEIATGPEHEYAAEPQRSERGHGFLDSVAHAGAAGARHGWSVSKGLGQMVGYVGSAVASASAGAMVGVGQGAVNHMLHGTPTGPEEEDAPQPMAASSSAAAPAPVLPVYLQDRESGGALPGYLQDRPTEARRSMLHKERQRYKDQGESTGKDPFYPWRPHRTP